jgi:hypothetical protein
MQLSNHRKASNGNFWMKCLSQVVFACMIFATPVISGEVKDLETALRETYADYRIALFMTNTSKSDESAKAIKAFDPGWKKLSAKWRQKPPPQKVDDTEWGQTFNEVASTIEKASSEIASNKLPAAHETLEAGRFVLGNLHQCNDIMSFSDRLKPITLSWKTL